LAKNVLPKVIVHNSISIDGSLTNFEPSMELHYRIAENYKADAHLIGWKTIKTGIELFQEEVPPEEKKDFEKAKKDEKLPYWVILDTGGELKGLLHTCRRFEFCKDVIVLVSRETPKGYLEYLKERAYDFHSVGEKHVDLKKSLELLAKRYNVKKVLVDSGRVLSNLLLKQGLVDEVSLLIHPVIVGNKAYNIFSDVDNSINLQLRNKETMEKGCVWLVYRVIH
jgi:2,5-diamino-6-(ribosylamino)-4(3H)-pyrimidinone 5'-phosphate reductase